MPESIFDFSARAIDGTDKRLADYRGKVLLVVNTASRCGFTPQYEGLEKIYREYRDRGFEVLGFPCNQFAGQEPEGEKEIKEFCSLRFNVSFPMFSKIEVNGRGTHPLYAFLKKKAGGFLSGNVKWNFTKFLVDRDGIPVRRFPPSAEPTTLRSDIEALLQKG